MSWRYAVTRCFLTGTMAGTTSTFVTDRPYELGKTYWASNLSASYKIIAVHDFRLGRYLEAA